MADADDFTPAPAAFRQTLEVTPDEIDQLGHFNNVAWVRWVQDIAVAHSDAIGWTLQAYHELGAVWVVRRHDIEYLAPAFAGERVTGATWVAQMGKTSSRRRTVFARESDGKPLCRAETTWVLVAKDGRPTEVPEAMKRAYAGAGDESPGSAAS